MTEPPILEVSDLNISFADEKGVSRVVRGAQFSVSRDCFTALVGESGCGKTVTALSVCRLVRPYRIWGTVVWRGAAATSDCLRLSDAELQKIRGREIAYVFQDPDSSFNPVLKVGDQIDESYRLHFGADREKAKSRTMELLRSMKISDVKRVYGSYPHQLSGGMKQRAMIAMALISEPKLLIADEPTTALDVVTELEIMELLASIRRERSLTLFFITHDLGLASAYAENILVMREGRIVERMEKISGGFRPEENYTKRLFETHFSRLTPKTLIAAP